MSPYRSSRSLPADWRERATSLRAFRDRLARLQPSAPHDALNTVEQMAAIFDQCATDFEQARERGEI